jgi:hypothetical protein
MGDLAGGPAGGTTDQRAQTGQQFLHAEGFGKVIVRPRIQPVHLVGPGIAGGQDQHRHGPAGAAPALQHRHPVHPRQAQIEHHGVVILGFAQEQRLLAVIGAIDRISGFGQDPLKLKGQPRFILDHQQSHRLPFAFRNAPVRAS